MNAQSNQQSISLHATVPKPMGPPPGVVDWSDKQTGNSCMRTYGRSPSWNASEGDYHPNTFANDTSEIHHRQAGYRYGSVPSRNYVDDAHRQMFGSPNRAKSDAKPKSGSPTHNVQSTEPTPMTDFGATFAAMNIQLPSELWSNPTTQEEAQFLSHSTLLDLRMEMDDPTYSSMPSSQGSVGSPSSSNGPMSGGSADIPPPGGMRPSSQVPRNSPYFNAQPTMAPSHAGLVKPTYEDYETPQVPCRKGAHHKKKDQLALQPHNQHRTLDPKKYKTRMCRNWQVRHCTYGDACVYAHGEKQLRGEQTNEAVMNSLTKLADQVSKNSGGRALGRPSR